MSYEEAIASWFHLIAWLALVHTAWCFHHIDETINDDDYVQKSYSFLLSASVVSSLMMFSPGIQSCDFVTRTFLDHRLWRSFPPCIFMHIRVPITAKQLIRRVTCLSNSIPHSYNSRSFDQSSTVRRCSSPCDFLSSPSFSFASVFLSKADIYQILLFSCFVTGGIVMLSMCACHHTCSLIMKYPSKMRKKTFFPPHNCIVGQPAVCFGCWLIHLPRVKYLHWMVQLLNVSSSRPDRDERESRGKSDLIRKKVPSNQSFPGAPTLFSHRDLKIACWSVHNLFSRRTVNTPSTVRTAVNFTLEMELLGCRKTGRSRPQNKRPGFVREGTLHCTFYIGHPVKFLWFILKNIDSSVNDEQIFKSRISWGMYEEA